MRSITGTVHFNKPPHANDTTSDVGSFSRSGKGSTLTVSKVPADPTDEFPPGRVTDLTASIVDDKIQLTWTAPGDDFDEGLGNSFNSRYGENGVKICSYISSFQYLIDFIFYHYCFLTETSQFGHLE